MNSGGSLRVQKAVRFISGCVIWLVVLAQPVDAALTNLAIGNSNFEDLSAMQYTNTAFENASNIPTAQWSTFGNGYEILTQGADSAPATFVGGAPTGQSLEILGAFSNGQISLIIDIPSNVIAGSLAQISFQAWSLDDGTTDYYNSGRLRINNVPGNPLSQNSGTPRVIFTTQNAWTLNTETYQVNPGDTLYIQWRDNITRSNNFGIRIDDVQVLVSIVPEPGHIGMLVLGGIMVASFWRKRRLKQPASA
jgi:hypothetical protein